MIIMSKSVVTKSTVKANPTRYENYGYVPMTAAQICQQYWQAEHDKPAYDDIPYLGSDNTENYWED
jgi:hypothetical protein